MSLKEIPQRLQNEQNRRWFHCQNADLYVWEKEGTIERFEFCYDETFLHPAAWPQQHSLRWSDGQPCRFMCVDDGQSTAFDRSSPILINCCEPNLQDAARSFRLLSQSVPLSICHRVLRTITDAMLS